MGATGWEGTCCVCDQEDGCACKNGPNNFKCVDGNWKKGDDNKEGSDYAGGGGFAPAGGGGGFGSTGTK